MVGPTIVGLVGVVIRSISGPVIATVGVSIAAMPDFLDCTKFDQAQRQVAWLRTGWNGRGEHQTHRARSSKNVQT